MYIKVKAGLHVFDTQDRRTTFKMDARWIGVTHRCPLGATRPRGSLPAASVRGEHRREPGSARQTRSFAAPPETASLAPAQVRAQVPRQERLPQPPVSEQSSQ